MSVAERTAQCQVFRFIPAAVLARNDMVNRKPLRMRSLRELAVFATVTGSLPNELEKSPIHIALGGRRPIAKGKPRLRLH